MTIGKTNTNVTKLWNNALCPKIYKLGSILGIQANNISESGKILPKVIAFCLLGSLNSKRPITIPINKWVKKSIN